MVKKENLVGLLVAFLVGLFSNVSVAQVGTGTFVRYETALAKTRTFRALDESLFGDSVSLQDGSIRFAQTDVAGTLTSGLRLALGRKSPNGRPMGFGTTRPYIFGDWELDVPYMRATFDSREGWNAGTLDGRRCSLGTFVPKATPYASTALGSGSNAPSSFFKGIHIGIPGTNEEQLLKANASQLLPTDGLTYLATTKSQMRIACLSTIKNGPGEGFVARLPDGTIYQFDWMVSRTIFPNMLVWKPYPQGLFAPLAEYHLYATRVTDRHGNWVAYNYDPANPERLLSITSNEGARIDIQYNSDGLVSGASYNARQWTYVYNGGVLASLTLPDQSSWQFSGASQSVLTGNYYWAFNTNFWNTSCRAGLGSGSAKSGYGLPGAEEINTISMVHPSGARADFDLYLLRHGTQGTPGVCFFTDGGYPSPPTAGTWGVPAAYLAMSLVQKRLGGPGMAAVDWHYVYEPNWSFGPKATCDSTCGTSSQTTVTRSDGVIRHYSYGNYYGFNLGQLLSESVEFGGAVLKRTDYTYATTASGYPFPDSAGDIPGYVPGYSFPAGYPEGDWGNPFLFKHRPVTQITTTVDGSQMTRRTDSFDNLVRPTQLTKYSSSGLKTETLSYHDRSDLWVMGNLARTTTNGIETSNVEYGNYALPLRRYSFGRLIETLDYQPNGALRSVTTPGGAVTSYGDWNLGVPQLIEYRRAAGEPAVSAERTVVDANGWITAVTNEAGSTTGYGYDAMGRMARISYPSEVGGSYFPTTVLFEQIGVAEHGIASGHWRQTITTGNAQTIRWFDALWRVRLEQEVDLAAPSTTSSMVEYRYGPSGLKTFQSHRQAYISPVDTSVGGTQIRYDALNRELETAVDSEIGLLRTTSTYLPGFQKRVINPRGYATTSTYRVFDQLDEAALVRIDAPESVSLTFDRNVFGQPTAISRGGNGRQTTRTYVYDPFMRLCKRVEAESGATVLTYDEAGNIAWRAEGQSLPSANSCDSGVVPASAKVSFGYDHRNRLTTTRFGDGSPGIDQYYTADGLLQQIASSYFTWTYVYNTRRLLTQEQFSLQGQQAPGTGWNFTWGIDGHGNISSLTDPWGTMQYSPTAFGKPTQVSGYVSDVTYHPNGIVAAYKLANGINHTVTLNARGLPELRQDSSTLTDKYTYDANGNVAAIQDLLGNQNSRSMGYDGLDRLTAANGPWGNGKYSYDSLDNLTYSQVGSRVLNHEIDSATNRLSRISGTGIGTVEMAYDANGNVMSRGTQGFSFDIGNRMRSAAGKATYEYDGHGRRSWIVFADGNWQLSAYSGTGPAGRLLFSNHSARGNTRYVYLGNELIAEVNAQSGTTYRHTDALGSPVARTSSSGVLMDRTQYEAYGANVAGSTPPMGIGFTGHVNDDATGLVYMQQRYYDPIAGRFLSVDPIVTDVNTGKGFGLYTYVENNPYSKIDPDGRRDIYIGGASDKDSTRIVQDYAAGQQRLNPGRDIQYFSYSEKKEITAAINAPLKDGEPLNVIGHSLGGREAINQANSTDATITNLVSIDPVGSAGNGTKPANVGTWTDVTATPSDRNTSDTVASTGRFFLGTTKTSGADSAQKVTTSHGNFSTMMSQSGSQQKVDNSYQKPKDTE